MPCLAVPEIHDLVTGRLDAESLAVVDRHLDDCESCREIVASAGVALGETLAPARPRDALLLPAGTMIDRFAIEEVVGRGAMGVVYAARDPRLERRVALKLLRADREGRAREAGELLLEAQSMARLAHPNVVAVYDVGTVAQDDDEVYVAMELVSGASLTEWLAQERREWREVLDVLLAAGAGLAAAHQAGVCHRDFKPDNIIIGDDGRARVTDFGLARAPAAVEADDRQGLEKTLTSVAGTPVYMAPELFSGAKASAQSDQYSFCITAFEAWSGRRPFDATGLDELVSRARKGEVQWPRDVSVPRKIQGIIERGLSPAPEQRFDSMQVLLATLRAAAARKRRMVAVGLASAAAAAVIATIATSTMSSAAPDPCAHATDKMGEVWGAAQRSQMQEKFRAAPPSFGKEAGERTARALDAFASRWSTIRLESCQATHVRHEQSDELFDRQVQCLDRRLSEMRAMQEQVSDAEAGALVDAPLWADGLGDLNQCESNAALQQAVARPDSAEVRGRVEAITTELDRAAAMFEAGRVGPARALATEMLQASEGTGYAPIISESQQLLAGILIDEGELDEAAELLEKALLGASQAMDHRRVADLSVTRIYLVGARQQKFEAALAFTSAARAAVAQAGSDPIQLAGLHMNTGAVYDLAGKREEAEGELKEALALYREHKGGRSKRVGDVLHNLGALAMERGDRDSSESFFRQALEVREELFGPFHPSVAQTCLGLGALARRANDLESARGYYQRAESIYTSVFGPEHAGLGAVHNNLAIVFMIEENFAQAEKQHRRALAIRTAEYGEEHPLVAKSMSGLGNTLVAQERHDEALAWHEKSVALRKATYPPEHPSVGIGLHGLAAALSGLEKFQEAVDARREAMRIFMAMDADAADIAGMQFDQAKDLWRIASTATARSESLTLAREAREGFNRAGESSGADLAKVDAWLADVSAATKKPE